VGNGPQLGALRALFKQGADPYAGADMPTVRNAVAVLLALHTALATAFVLLAPPAPGTGTAGWIIALTVVGASAACTVWVVSARCEVTFNRLLVLSYLGLASTLALEVVSAAFVPYELLFLVWVGCGAVQPAGRAAVFFGSSPWRRSRRL
jgi:hypothetical protein